MLPVLALRVVRPKAVKCRVRLVTQRKFEVPIDIVNGRNRIPLKVGKLQVVELRSGRILTYGQRAVDRTPLELEC